MQGGYGSSSSSSGRSGSSGSSGKSGSSGSSDKSKYINIGLAILAIIILLFLIGSYYNHRTRTESFLDSNGNAQNRINGDFRPGPEQPTNTNTVKPQQGMGKNEVFSSVPSKEEPPTETKSNDQFGLHGNQYPTDCYPKDTLTASELLPSDANSKWAQVNPSGQGELGDQNFLEAGFHIGTNTIGQTLRNPNLQLRSEPSNPQVKVSPWMQTTIEPDTNRRGLEIGGN